MKRIAGKGWIPDVPDKRDALFSPRRFDALVPEVLPQRVDLRDKFPACYDQGHLGSCTANAIAGVIEFDQATQKIEPVFLPSRLFIYYNERAMEGTIRSDAGAQIRDGIKSLSKQGAPPETMWPYVETKFTTKPPRPVYTEAKKHPAVKYARVTQTEMGIRQCLASGWPFVFGFTVYDAFESDAMEKSGTLELPKTDESVVGGHAVCAVGYEGDRLLVRNSWGTDWGQGGYFTMPIAYLTNRDLADDFWVISQVA